MSEYLFQRILEICNIQNKSKNEGVAGGGAGATSESGILKTK